MVLTHETNTWSGTIHIHCVNHKHVAVIEASPQDDDGLDCVETDCVIAGLTHSLNDVCKKLDEHYA